MKKLIFLILSVVYVMPLFAEQSKKEGIQFAGQWGFGGKVIDSFRCRGTAKEAGFQYSENNEAYSAISWSYFMSKFVNYAGEYYIARNINNNGAEFCKTVVAAQRKDCYSRGVTVYYEPVQKDCFWLCKSGFSGPGCKPEDVSATNYSQSPSEYAAKKTAAGTVALQPGLISGANIEDKIPMLVENKDIKCTTYTDVGGTRANFVANNAQEHDVVLAIYEIKADADSVIFDVRPMIVRGAIAGGCFANNSKRSAWPMISWDDGTSSTLVCPSDYGRVGDECVHPLAAASLQLKNAAEELKNTQLGSLCYGYKKEGYDEAQHSFVVVENGTGTAIDPQPTKSSDFQPNYCTKYVCKSSVMGFVSDWKTSGNMKCETCTGESMRYGVDADGACITCVKGEIYDEDKKTCVKAASFSKNDMRYGQGKTPSTDLKDQCWTLDNPTCYKCCLTNNVIPGTAECDECKLDNNPQ